MLPYHSPTQTKKAASPNLGLWNQQANLYEGTLRITRGRGLPPDFPLPIWKGRPFPSDCLTFMLLLERCEGKRRGGNQRAPSLGNALPGHPQAPMCQLEREGTQAKICQYFWLYRAKRQGFYIVQNRKLSYEHGPPQSPNQSSFYKVATHYPF